MAFSLYPAFAVISYTTLNATHKMTIPTREWDAGIGTNGKGGYIGWDSGAVDADDMMNALAAVIAPVIPNTAVIDGYVIYTLEAANGAPARPRAANSLTVPGTGTLEAIPATQATYNFRTSGFGHFKLVLLDVHSNSDFDKQRIADLSTDQANLIAELQNSEKAWQGRDGTQIGELISVTWTLNEKLRKSYKNA